MDFALMFNILEGGVAETIKWNKESLSSERSILILDESSLVVWLWHGSKLGLVSRRTALRQAQSLKGHGYTVGKSIIGRNIKVIKEVDQRKIGRDPETDKDYEILENLLNKEFRELENLVITFSTGAIDTAVSGRKPASTAPPKPVVEQVEQQPSSTAKSSMIASEYDESPSIELKAEPKREKTEEELALEEAKVGFVIMAVLDHFADVWISKKPDGVYVIEMMDGPVCQFSIPEGTIKFSANSFQSIDPNIKNQIKKKFIELSKLL